jgi:carbon starvation protein
MSKLGLPLETGISFAALTVSAFALTTLDTATRLSRFSFQEFFTLKKSKKMGIREKWLTNRFVGTTVSVAAGGGLALSGQWKAIWPLFGSANQLLAALALLAVTLWLKNRKIANWFVRWPMYFMYIMTNCALLLLLWKNIQSENYSISFFTILLLGVSISMVIRAVKALRVPLHTEYKGSSDTESSLN